MKNEKGFASPIVLVVSTSFILLAGYMMEQFVLDKRFYKEVEETLMSDHLLRLAVRDLEREWGELEEVIIEPGILLYPNGDVYYEVVNQNEEVALVYLYGSTVNNRKGVVLIYYDKNVGKVTEWVEK